MTIIYLSSRVRNSFHVDYPDSGDPTIDVVEDIPVDVPNILPIHPAFQLDFYFISSNDLGSDLNASSLSRDRNKIYDPEICIEVESTRILATLSPVIKTLLAFSSDNENKVFNHGVLASKEKSPSSLSHRGLKFFQLSPESPMLIHGDNTPNLGTGYSLKDKKMKLNRTKLSTNLERARKTEAKGSKGLKTELKRKFPDRLDNVYARSLWKAIKARFGGNEASKKMQKNLLKQQFETFTIGSREELDSAYERFQHILSMLDFS
ncbi:hypothetical protein Tco_0260192 [Tanacetum coccineum]